MFAICMLSIVTCSGNWADVGFHRCTRADNLLLQNNWVDKRIEGRGGSVCWTCWKSYSMEREKREWAPWCPGFHVDNMEMEGVLSTIFKVEMKPGGRKSRGRRGSLMLGFIRQCWLRSPRCDADSDGYRVIEVEWHGTCAGPTRSLLGEKQGCIYCAET